MIKRILKGVGITIVGFVVFILIGTGPTVIKNLIDNYQYNHTPKPTPQKWLVNVIADRKKWHDTSYLYAHAIICGDTVQRLILPHHIFTKNQLHTIYGLDEHDELDVMLGDTVEFDLTLIKPLSNEK